MSFSAPEDADACVPFKVQFTLINHFMLNTVKFLNKFGIIAEHKLQNVSERIDRVEKELLLLESKLAHIPGLDQITVTSPTSQVDEVSSSQTSMQQNTDRHSTAAPAAPSAGNGQTVSDHPAYAKYFQLIKLSMPIEQVKLKMSSEGANPDLLDHPNAPISMVDTGVANGNDTSMAPPPPPPTASIPPTVPDESIQENETNNTVLKIKDDPEYSKYFKMLAMGVPEVGVKQKMVTEGKNPDLLDTPDGPSPNQDGVVPMEE